MKIQDRILNNIGYIIVSISLLSALLGTGYASDALSQGDIRNNSLPRGRIIGQRSTDWRPGIAIKFRRVERVNGCRELLPKDAWQCLKNSRSRQSFVEIAREDVDADGKTDFMLRIISLDNCGTLGCGVSIYLKKQSGLKRVGPNIVSFGDAKTCLSHGKPGIRFNHRNFAGKCFLVSDE